MEPIAIVGAGIAGLTAADALNARGLPTIIFEAGKSVGGMASTFKDENGFSYDVGAHFVSNRLADALGAGDICRTVRRYGEAVMLRGRSYAYPFGLMLSPRFAPAAIAERFRDREVHTAEDWYRKKFGDVLADEVAIPLTEAWSGAPAASLSPSLGAKFGPRILKSLYLNAAAIVTGRAVCNGYSHEMPESADVFHVYPEGGIAKLLEPMTRRLEHQIRLESPVEKIVVDKGRVRAVRVKGAEIAVSAAISTAPVHVLPKLVEGTTALDHLRSFRYRPMIFVNLRFSGRGYLPNTILWVPDRDKAFFRITETPLSMPWLAPEGKTLLTFDIGAEVGDRHWNMSEDELAAVCLRGLGDMYPQMVERYLGTAGVVRTPISYPVYLAEYEEARQRFSRSTGIEGLWSVGRNGEFAHMLMEDVYWKTLKRAEDVAAYVLDGARSARMEDAERLEAGSINQAA